MSEAIEVACPKCHTRLAVDAAVFNAPPGQLPLLTCRECGHKAPVGKFSRERDREVRALAKAAEKDRHDREAAERKRTAEAERARRHEQQVAKQAEKLRNQMEAETLDAEEFSRRRASERAQREAGEANRSAKEGEALVREARSVRTVGTVLMWLGFLSGVGMR